jgi:hypothetical protein
MSLRCLIPVICCYLLCNPTNQCLAFKAHWILIRFVLMPLLRYVDDLVFFFDSFLLLCVDFFFFFRVASLSFILFLNYSEFRLICSNLICNANQYLPQPVPIRVPRRSLSSPTIRSLVLCRTIRLCCSYSILRLLCVLS